MLAHVTYELGTGGPLHKLENVQLMDTDSRNLTPIRLKDGTVKIINNRFIVEVEAL